LHCQNNMSDYSKVGILSNQIQGSTQLGRLTRNELWNRLQLIRTIEPINQRAFVKAEDERWRNENQAPHGNPWHVSFHASQFPGDDPLACPRKALYTMMNFPEQQAFSRKSRHLMSIGLAIEQDLVDAWYRAGILLSAAPEDDFQTGFEFPEVWLTGSVDSVIKIDGRAVPVEIKTKSAEVIAEMQVGKKGPDPRHVSQLKVQIALARTSGKWDDLKPITHGFLYYLSRNDPTQTAEFRVDYDEHFFDAGIEKLRRWRGWFEEGLLPSIDSTKRHPMGWRWSYEPCKWCPFKKTCQEDHKEGISDLMESNGVFKAGRIRDDYDAETARLKVLARWKDKKNAD
jgi:CRISPR/Cas system-associated exonuclease Cas4 (RecB family)